MFVAKLAKLAKLAKVKRQECDFAGTSHGRAWQAMDARFVEGLLQEARGYLATQPATWTAAAANADGEARRSLLEPRVERHGAHL